MRISNPGSHFSDQSLVRTYMEDFPSNSQRHRGPSEPKRIERVTSAEAVRRKRGLGRQFKDTFIGGDARTAFSYMIVDIMIPSMKDSVVDALQGGIEKWLVGEVDSRRSRRYSSPNGYNNVGHVDYRGMGMRSAPAKSPSPRMLSRSSRARGVFDELIIPTRQEAEEVIDRMFDILSRYGAVSVADLYELTGIQSQHTDMKWGWIGLPGARAVRLRQGGYLLDLPEPEAFE
jgi:hypothetical protein